MIKWILILPLALVFSGCAYNRPHLSETVVVAVSGTNGTITTTTTTREMTLRSYTILTSTESVAKQKASIGKTMGVGTEGLGQDAIGPNAARILEAWGNALIAMGKAAAVP